MTFAKLLAAVLLSPLAVIPALMVGGPLALLGGFQLNDVSVYIAFAAVVGLTGAYVGVIIFSLPLHFLLRWLGLNRIWHYMFAAALLTGIPTGVLMVLSPSGDWGSTLVFFVVLIWCSVWVAGAFWFFAVKKDSLTT